MFSNFAKPVAQAFQEIVKEPNAFVVDAAKRRAENKAEREQLLAALADKQAGKLSAMSEAQLRKKIEALSAEE